MPIETRSNSALFRRAEQLKRWEDSETNQVSAEIPPNKKSKIKFSDGCVFLAACAAGDTEEVERLLEHGADINTANVDGLTALHQACIDDNLEMVQFLVEHGCDVNQGDNEGWTPLHATASCGFVSIAKYLIEHGANIAAVNNDGDLPIDIAESPKMEELLSDVLDEQGIDCDEARSEEERIMLEDANQWLNSQKYQDRVHPRTGATALHVAAAKGYIKVMNVLIKAGADLNAQDNDGWTPLHAAAHWGQKEACAVLADNLANMDIQNFAGQTCFDVAEPELVKLLEELKKKQASMQKDRPDIQAILQRTSTRPPLKRRTSVTRMSCQEKSKSVMKDTKAERAQIEQMTLPEEDVDEEKERKHLDIAQRTLSLRQDVRRLEAALQAASKAQEQFEPPEKPVKKEPTVERVPSWKKVLRRSPENLADEFNTSFESEVVLKKPRHLDDQEAASAKPSNGPEAEESKGEGRAVPDDKRSSDALNHSTEESADATPSHVLSHDSADLQTHGKRAFIPPARDEESELQRKAHAKRVRETRRSTQGVLLEDVKTAELQYIIKKTQAERKDDDNDAEAKDDELTSEVRSAGKALSSENDSEECREKSKEEEARSSESLKPIAVDACSDETLTTNKSAISNSPDSTVTFVLRTKTSNNSDEQSSPDSRSSLGTQAAIQRRRRPKRRSTGVVYLENDDSTEDKSSRQEVMEKESQEENESIATSEPTRHRYGSAAHSDATPETSRNETASRYSSLSSSRSSLNSDGDKDYKKLYEELKAENERLHQVEKENEQLKETLKKTEEELERTKAQMKKLLENHNAKYALGDAEKKERRALERKLSEMEEEVKNISKLKAENEKLKAENRALSRVVCKLSK